MKFDPFADGFLDDPYPAYAAWRAREPVHWGTAPDQMGEGCWYVFDHATARAALADDRLGCEIARVVPPEYLPPVPPDQAAFFQMIGRWMIFRDPPDHTRLRRAMAPGFGASALQTLEADIAGIVDFLVRGMDDRDEIDLIADFAFPLPVLVIARLLGFGDGDYAMLKRCSHALLAGIDLRRAEDNDAARRAGAQAAAEIGEYLRVQIGRRRKGDSGDDLLARMVQAADGDEEELIANCALLLFAGHETTVNLIGNGMHALIGQEGAWAALAHEPARLPSAVEELARYDSSSQMTFRFAMEPLRLGEAEIAPGQPVAIVIGAANRDPAAFDLPDRLDLARAPNRHLAFGHGRHHCLGAGLARAETIAAYRALLARWSAVAPGAAAAVRAPSLGLRGFATLPVFKGNR